MIVMTPEHKYLKVVRYEAFMGQDGFRLEDGTWWNRNALIDLDLVGCGKSFHEVINELTELRLGTRPER